MVITSVVVNLSELHRSVVADAEVVFDGQFVIRDIKIVQLRDGRLIVHMPNRPRMGNCTNRACDAPNPLSALYCGQCGARFGNGRQRGEPTSLYRRDIVHPINNEFRTVVDEAVLFAYRAKVALVTPKIPAEFGAGIPGVG